MKSTRVLCVEDDAELLDDLVHVLRDAGHDVIPCSDGHEAAVLLSITRFDVILCDIQLPGMDGFEILDKARSAGSLMPSLWIFMTAYSDNDVRRRAVSQAGVMLMIRAQTQSSA